MELPKHLRDRIASDELPDPVYAMVGASQLVRERVVVVPGKARTALTTARSTRDRLTTTAYQMGFETRDRVVAAPGGVVQLAQQRWTQLRSLPGEASEQLTAVRAGARQQYATLTASGERALTQWQAERLLNQRADRLTRSVSPAAARATVSARDARRRTASSPTTVKVKQAGGRAKQAAKGAWDEYIAAVDEAGARQMGRETIDLTSDATLTSERG